MSFVDTTRVLLPTSLPGQSLELQLLFGRQVNATAFIPLTDLEYATNFGGVPGTEHAAAVSTTSYPWVLLPWQADSIDTLLAGQLASFGYLVLLIQLKPSTDPVDYVRDLAFAVTEAYAEANVTDSPMYHKLAGRFVCLGTGEGADACALLEQRAMLCPEHAFPPDVQLVGYLLLSPALHLAGVVHALRTLPAERELLVLSGAADCDRDSGLTLYNTACGASCKTFVRLVGGSTCLLFDKPPASCLPTAACTPQPALSFSQQQALVFPLLGHWLGAALQQNATAWTSFQQGLTLTLAQQATLGISGQPLFVHQNCARGGQLLHIFEPAGSAMAISVIP